MTARAHGIANRFFGDDSPYRKAAAKPFGSGDNIRFNAGLLIGKKTACAPHAALNLISDDKRAKFIGGGSNPFQIALWCGICPAFTLNRLNENRGNLITHRITKRVQITKRHMFKPCRKRAEPFSENRPIGGGKHAKRAAMKGIAST